MKKFLTKPKDANTAMKTTARDHLRSYPKGTLHGSDDGLLFCSACKLYWTTQESHQLINISNQQRMSRGWGVLKPQESSKLWKCLLIEKPIALQQNLPRKFPRNRPFFREYLSLQIPQNLTIFLRPIRSPESKIYILIIYALNCTYLLIVSEWPKYWPYEESWHS